MQRTFSILSARLEARRTHLETARRNHHHLWAVGAVAEDLAGSPAAFARATASCGFGGAFGTALGAAFGAGFGSSGRKPHAVPATPSHTAAQSSRIR
jgi:hypothetical protein